MSPAVAWLLTAGVVWPAAALALNWGRLAGHRRRAVALLTSLAGITALVVALSAHGQRETLTTGQFLLGGGYVTGHTSASASLRYYVATAVCLLLGTAGLAVPDETAGRLRQHWVGTAIGLSLVITGLRFALEKVAAPMSWTNPVGITWLAPVVGSGLPAQRARRGGVPRRPRLACPYALASRGGRSSSAASPVAARLALRPQPGHGRLVLGQHAPVRGRLAPDAVSRRAAPARSGWPTPWSRA
jgi:hypothetical protein